VRHHDVLDEDGEVSGSLQKLLEVVEWAVVGDLRVFLHHQENSKFLPEAIAFTLNQGYPKYGPQSHFL